MNDLRDFINIFYTDGIPEQFRQRIINAVNAAEGANELHVVEPLSTLTNNLIAGTLGNSASVNIYMADPTTRHSRTRRFFFLHTLPENLSPEDHEIYAPL